MTIECNRDIYNALNVLALSYRQGDRFTVLGDPPLWFHKLCPDSDIGDLGDPPEERFPFLSNFLIDARDFWSRGKNGRIRSGIWIQTAPDGDDLAFEASAIRLGDSNILIVESCEYEYSEKQSLIQTGRMLALDLDDAQRREHLSQNMREELESQVAQRTAALLQTNARLKREIEERRKAERSLRESERRFRTLFDNLFDAQLLVDTQGRICKANRAACELLGRSMADLNGRSIADLFHEKEAGKVTTALANAARSGSVYVDEMVLWGKGRSRIPVEGGGVGVDMDGRRHVVFSFRDISHRKQLQIQLQQSQKMEAMGSLASGISHDFNNILSAIIGYTEIVRMDLDQTSLAYRNLEQVLAAGKRAKDLVQQILTFSRQADGVREAVKVRSVVVEALKLIRATLPSSIRIVQQLDSHACVHCDPTHIHQICINLCSNAGHAMEPDGGQLDVRMTDITLDDDRHGLAPGKYVCLSVADTGKGIDDSVMGKIFDPFFTTKAFGKGTGMGLSVVHGIVTTAGGSITAKNRRDRGCRFEVLLPVMDAPGADAADVHEPLKTGTERILFVDD
jgi:PAS domain S-box-containing protein